MIYCVFSDDYQNFMPSNETIVNKIFLEKNGVKCIKRKEFFDDSIYNGLTDKDSVIVWVNLETDAQIDKFSKIKSKKYLKNIDTCKSDRKLFNKEKLLFEKINFDGILLTYDSKVHIEALEALGQKVVSYPHVLDFDDTNYIDEIDNKKYDVIISGQLSEKSYPTRTKIAKAIYKYSKQYDINAIHLPHPGYKINERRHDYIGENFIKLLSECKLVVTCTGDDDSMVMKYLESAKACSLPVGDIPTNMPLECQKSILSITKEDSEEDIIKKIKNVILNKIEYKERVVNYNKVMKSNYNIDGVIKKVIEQVKN